MTAKRFWSSMFWVFAGLTGWSLSAVSEEGRLGLAEPMQKGFQPAATETMQRIADFHDLLLIITGGIVVFVFGLLLWVIIKYNAKANPTPSKFSHNTIIEVLWTGLPIMILVLIGIPSFRLLYFQDTIPEADLIIKATGHQWYWTHEYPELNELEIHSRMLPVSFFDPDMSAETRAERQMALGELQRIHDMDRPPEIYRLLDTDTRIVVPINKTVKLLVTADDVLHSWAIPSFGIKIDAVPGRLNETWFKVNEVGTYYGQCSELCGINHSYMPIVIEAVSEEAFLQWLARAKALYASNAGAESIEMTAAD